MSRLTANAGPLSAPESPDARLQRVRQSTAASLPLRGALRRASLLATAALSAAIGRDSLRRPARLEDHGSSSPAPQHGSGLPPLRHDCPDGDRLNQTLIQQVEHFGEQKWITSSERRGAGHCTEPLTCATAARSTPKHSCSSDSPKSMRSAPWSAGVTALRGCLKSHEGHLVSPVPLPSGPSAEGQSRLARSSCKRALSSVKRVG